MKQHITYTPSHDQFYFDSQSLRDITDYLRATGWTRIKYQNRRLAVYAKELQAGELPAIVALPDKPSYSDFAARMLEAIQRLAEVEETTPDDVYQKIQSVGQDSIRLRLRYPSATVVPSLEVTTSFLQGVRDLIVYAACMEQEARPYFTQPFRIGREQVERCLFDHTFHGSFGFSIKSPLPPVVQLHLPGFGSPLERRIVERITRGLRSAELAKEKQRSEEISDHYMSGLNGNMCKAVLEMLEELPDTPVEYDVRWSVSLRPADDVERFTPIVLDKEVSSYLRDAARYLETTLPDLEYDKTIEGKVISLSIENQIERQVTLQADGYGKVSFLLDASDYATACDAHRDNLVVMVTGILQRNSRGGELWTLLSPRSFQVKQ
jgi:hypothetical protein